MNTQNDNSFQKPLQCALNVDKLKNTIIESSKDTQYLPIIMVTNGNIPLEIDLTMFDQKVILVLDKEDSDLIKSGRPFININKVNVKEKAGKAEFRMLYKQTKINIKVKKEGKNWIFKSFFSKRKKNRSYEIEF